ncbi:ORF6N domain-containing protein [Pseudoduganella sp. UC29_106]|uniref:ORF6N domain-containing protein n=1 Tax=Pseudoduganella sp. UC29_106 TaxID=3374553 RepID=UPI003757B065
MTSHPANLEQRILLARGQKVMLDSELAQLYGVPTKVLMQQVRRNIARFPEDFMFQLTTAEWEILRSHGVTSNSDLRSQIVTSNPNLNFRARRYHPHVFTEQGVAMLSSVLRSEQAIAVNVEIMRAFVRLRALIATNAELAHRLDELERRALEQSDFEEAVRGKVPRGVRGDTGADGGAGAGEA